MRVVVTGQPEAGVSGGGLKLSYHSVQSRKQMACPSVRTQIHASTHCALFSPQAMMSSI